MVDFGLATTADAATAAAAAVATTLATGAPASASSGAAAGAASPRFSSVRGTFAYMAPEVLAGDYGAKVACARASICCSIRMGALRGSESLSLHVRTNLSLS